MFVVQLIILRNVIDGSWDLIWEWKKACEPDGSELIKRDSYPYWVGVIGTGIFAAEAYSRLTR